MNNFTVSQIYPSDTKGIEAVKALLAKEDLTLDKNLDYIAALYDQNNIVATGSLFKNSLRCFAVDSDYQGQSLLNTLLSHLVEVQYNRGNTHLFIYTKPKSAKYFKDLGFYEIYQDANLVSFLENQPFGFKEYLELLNTESIEQVGPNFENKKQAAIVLNANPFTLGHLHLIKTACESNDYVHLFIVSDDSSLFPYTVRKQLIMDGTKDLKNVIYHDCGSYMISSATFPAYFQKDNEAVILSQAILDVNIFVKIAKYLNITSRYVGEEPFSQVTKLYNETMAQELKKAYIEHHIVSRFTKDNIIVSASHVREAIRQDSWELVKNLTPVSTFSFLQRKEAQPIIQKIKESQNVIHY